MDNVKTNIVAGLKVVAAIAYVVYKQLHGLPLGAEDTMILTLALGGSAGNLLSADAKKVEQPK